MRTHCGCPFWKRAAFRKTSSRVVLQQCHWDFTLPPFARFVPNLGARWLTDRQTFEEVGALIAYPSKNWNKSELQEWRTKVHDDAGQFMQMCKHFNIVPGVKHVVHWSNWITPVVEPKRFDTHFFLSVLPRPEDAMTQSSSASPDGGETTSLQWMTPSEALGAFKDRKIRMFPPQFYLLTELAQNYPSISSLKEFMDGKRRSNFDLVANCPEFTKSETGSACIVYPGDPLHSTTNQSVCNKATDRHRLDLTMGDEASGSVGQIVDMEFNRLLSKQALASFAPPLPKL